MYLGRNIYQTKNVVQNFERALMYKWTRSYKMKFAITTPILLAVHASWWSDVIEKNQNVSFRGQVVVLWFLIQRCAIPNVQFQKRKVKTFQFVQAASSVTVRHFLCMSICVNNYSIFVMIRFVGSVHIQTQVWLVYYL